MKRLMFLSVAVALSMLAAAVPPAASTHAAHPTSPDSENEAPRYSPELDQLRQQLAASGPAGVELARAEYITNKTGFDAATSQTLIANNRTHLINSQFVENDPRRGGTSYITYVVDQSDGSALTILPSNAVALLPNATTEPIVDQSMARWETGPNCNGPAVVKVNDTGGNIDVIDNLVLGGAPGSPIADITHGGWLAPAFFNAIAPPNGASFILGVTFTFIFVDQNGPTDIDNNGMADVAFREIYYNRGVPWATNGSSNNVDIESVATHEAGHAFGLGHFGKVFLTKKGSTIDDIKYAPRAVMNAVYVSPFRELTGTDNASFCRVWANSH
jgi:hypothetical protein